MAFIATIVNMPQLRRSNWRGNGNPRPPSPPIIEPPGRPPIKPRCSGGYQYMHVRNMPVGPRGKGNKNMLYKFGCRRTTARAVRMSRYTRNGVVWRGVPAQYLPAYRNDRRVIGGRRIPRRAVTRYKVQED